MNKWEDETKGYPPVIKGSRIKFGNFKLSVHHYKGFPEDQWFVSSPYIFDCISLESKDLNEAKTQAKAMLQLVLQDAIKEILAK